MGDMLPTKMLHIFSKEKVQLYTVALSDEGIKDIVISFFFSFPIPIFLVSVKDHLLDSC